MCVILSATVTLCCLFMPKMYIVLMHPEKYARAMPGERGLGSTGGSGAKGNVVRVLNTNLLLLIPSNRTIMFDFSQR